MNSRSMRNPAGKPEIQATSACPCDSPAVANCSIQLCQFAEKFPRHAPARSVARGGRELGILSEPARTVKRPLRKPLLDASERATLRLLAEPRTANGAASSSNGHRPQIDERGRNFRVRHCDGTL